MEELNYDVIINNVINSGKNNVHPFFKGDNTPYIINAELNLLSDSILVKFRNGAEVELSIKVIKQPNKISKGIGSQMVSNMIKSVTEGK